MIKVCIEVEAGSCERHRYHAKTLQYEGTRLATRPYPYPYGFILGTRAADRENVDCYLITTAPLQAGTVVECEPIGLLEQEEDGEVDHKVIAALPGQDVEGNEGLRQELRAFIVAVFAPFPDMHVRVGRLLPREAALQHIAACHEA
jgi:inorganic pyrophosphatase